MYVCNMDTNARRYNLKRMPYDVANEGNLFYTSWAHAQSYAEEAESISLFTM